MSETTGTTRALNALDGQETVDTITHKITKDITTHIERSLVSTGEFGKHRTFPLFRLRYEVSLAVYPSQELDDDPKIRIKGEVVLGEGPVPEIPPVEVASVSFNEVIDTPDKERKEAGLPITVPSKGPGNVIIDKPIQPRAGRPIPHKKG